MLSALVLPFVSFGLPRGVCAVLTVRFFGVFLVLYLLWNVGFRLLRMAVPGRKWCRGRFCLKMGGLGNALVYNGFCAALPMGRVCIYMNNVKNKPCLPCNQGFSEARTSSFCGADKPSLWCEVVLFRRKGRLERSETMFSADSFLYFVSSRCQTFLPLRRRVCPIFAGVPDASFSDVCSLTEKTRMSIFF